MKNQKVKILALVMAGCLCITGLTGCGGGEKDTSSQSDNGTTESVKEESDTADESESDTADE